MACDSVTCVTRRDQSRTVTVQGVTRDIPLRGMSRDTNPQNTALAELADRIRRLVPSRSDPERFHVEKSEIEHELRRLARKVK